MLYFWTQISRLFLQVLELSQRRIRIPLIRSPSNYENLVFITGCSDKNGVVKQENDWGFNSFGDEKSGRNNRVVVSRDSTVHIILAPFTGRVDYCIHWINRYLADKC